MTVMPAESPILKSLDGTITLPPRLGFLGVGWIGKNRLEAIAGSGAGTVTAIADASTALTREVARAFPQAAVLDSLEDLLATDLDGIVIATPSALHAEQAIAALERGVAVFCQKPLGRSAKETRRVIDAARAANRLLGVDLSYRFIGGAKALHQLCRSGELGDIFAVDLIFHNAYGPDKAWFYDWKLSGGGCVIDLGIHLVDLALWNLGFPKVANVTSRLFAEGQPTKGRFNVVEDFALARLDLENGMTVNLTCSWKLPAGRDAIISASFYGTKGGAALHNLNGSFYDFTAERYRGTKREVLASRPESWGGCAAIDWAKRLAAGSNFAEEIETVAQVAQTLDNIYENSGANQRPATILSHS
jgi:predicted dehydrogenase